MKKKIGIVSMFFMLTIVFTAVFSISASALTEEDWEFQLLDDEVTITNYLGNSSNITIPEKIYNSTVTIIKAKFKEASTITFPSTVKKIESYTCRDNKNLKKVILPEGIETIGDSAFSGCENLSDITLPSTLRVIENCAFSHCYAIKTIDFPSELTKIGHHEPGLYTASTTGAFYDSGLETIDLSGTEASLNVCAFAYCKNLKSVKLNNAMKKIPNSLFDGCESLRDIDIPEGVEIIESSAFENCKSLESIILPVNLKKINDYSVFSGCSGLKEIVIPYGTQKIGSFEFQNCTNLEAIYIPETVTDLGYDPVKNSPKAIIYCSSGSKVAEICKSRSISYLTDESVNGLITVYYNGSRVSFSEYGQNAEIIDNRTLVPLRAIFEAMNADVQWDQETQTVTSTRGNVTIKLTIGANEIYKNGSSIPVDVPAQIINDRTMIPVRVIAEAFGADVEWNGSGRAVLINE